MPFSKNCDAYVGEVPDQDMEICLKVIRTVRNCCLGNSEGFFDADGAVVLTHAHAKIVELWEVGERQQQEELAPADPTDLLRDQLEEKRLRQAEEDERDRGS